MRIATIYRIEEGILAGTEIEGVMGFLSVKYPHRKTRDLYIPPTEANGKKVTTFHCCQERCGADLDNFDAVVKHLELHAGRLFKKLRPVTKKHPAIVLVSLPPNPWAEGDLRGVNSDRHFVVRLYRENVKASLAKQGIGVKD